ncbi:hypothetical protein GS462_26900 [Rhodococcus hoagii]|nr:hypothetical protein [Prescottella equi]
MEKLTGSYVSPSAGRITLGEVAELWIAGKVNLSASTASRYRSALDVHILPEFETKPIADLTRERLRKWVSKMVENSSAATVREERRRPVADPGSGSAGFSPGVESCRRSGPAEART